MFNTDQPFRRRFITLALAGLAVIAGFTVSSVPTLMIDGTLGAAQSNFSFSFYGLAAGGKGWTQVLKDHPEIFRQSANVADQTSAIFTAAFENIREQPHLLAIGYLKGLAHYFTDLFRFAHDFKPLRFLFFTPLWIAGVLFAVKMRRNPQFALLLWLQAGILVSAPFITFDGGNRVYAATLPVDALFVGVGLMWLCGHGESRAVPASRTKDPVVLIVSGLAAVLVPLSALVAIRLGATKFEYAQPVCANGLEAAVVRPSRSTLLLPLVTAGDESIYPLRVRADHFAQRLHKHVHNASEFRRETGTTLVWGIRLDAGKLGQQIFFTWKGEIPKPGETLGFCVEKPPKESSRSLGTAVKIRPGPARR